MSLCVTLLIVDLRQYCVCCIRSGVIWCTLSIVLYLCRMRQCGMHSVLWSQIGILMCLHAAKPRSTAGRLFPSQCHCGTILLTLYSMVWDWRAARAWPMLFYWPKLLDSFLHSTVFPFLSIGWYCGAGVFRLIGCKSLSLSLALPTSFN